MLRPSLKFELEVAKKSTALLVQASFTKKSKLIFFSSVENVEWPFQNSNKSASAADYFKLRTVL